MGHKFLGSGEHIMECFKEIYSTLLEYDLVKISLWYQ